MCITESCNKTLGELKEVLLNVLGYDGEARCNKTLGELKEVLELVHDEHLRVLQ